MPLQTTGKGLTRLSCMSELHVRAALKNFRWSLASILQRPDVFVQGAKNLAFENDDIGAILHTYSTRTVQCWSKLGVWCSLRTRVDYLLLAHKRLLTYIPTSDRGHEFLPPCTS